MFFVALKVFLIIILLLQMITIISTFFFFFGRLAFFFLDKNYTCIPMARKGITPFQGDLLFYVASLVMELGTRISLHLPRYEELLNF